ncbi:hypothetical protein VTK56DRAFT_5048 [Thermocarpiscus australiensis]
MNSAIECLTGVLALTDDDMTRYVIACFHNYVLNFLCAHPNAMDPDVEQIRVRLRLAISQPSAPLGWNQHAVKLKQTESQNVHATLFVQRVLEYLFSNALRPHRYNRQEMIYQIHRRLSALQSLWLGDGLWVDDEQFQVELRNVLITAMKEVELERIV